MLGLLPRSRQVRCLTASARHIALTEKYAATTYKPISVVLTRAKGCIMWDVDGKEYYDFLSAYSAVNQGHCHPRLVKAVSDQAAKLTLTSRAFYNDKLGLFSEYITRMFGYDRVLPMNTGVEGGESAVKLARKWAYEVKGVPDGKALVLFATGNFWGRTIAAVSSSSDPEAYNNYGPYVPGFTCIPYNDLPALERILVESGSRIAAFMVEPIQGEAGVVVPAHGYMRAAAALCKKHNVLLIADEVQTGLSRTGYLLASEHDGARPDIVVLGKALSGGIMPVSAVLADDAVMLTIKPGQHGSTFGGNPLACVVAQEALQILIDEKLSENATARGEQLRAGLTGLVREHPSVLSEVRGRGLLCALVVHDDARGRTGETLSALDLCYGFKNAATHHGCSRGLLAKPTHNTIIRLAPPLVISAEQVDDCLSTIRTVVHAMAGK